MNQCSSIFKAVMNTGTYNKIIPTMNKSGSILDLMVQKVKISQ